VEEAFQGLDSFEGDLKRNSGAENGQDDYARKAQASELTVVCWSRKGSLGSGNPRHSGDINGVELLAKQMMMMPFNCSYRNKNEPTRYGRS